jgi:hypothetical protein
MPNPSTPQTPGGTTKHDEEPDYRLRVFLWGVIANEEPRIEYFGPTEWEKAIDRAREVSRSPERLSRIQVIDAWGMLIAQFCPQTVFMTPAQYEANHS